MGTWTKGGTSRGWFLGETIHGSMIEYSLGNLRARIYEVEPEKADIFVSKKITLRKKRFSERIELVYVEKTRRVISFSESGVTDDYQLKKKVSKDERSFMLNKAYLKNKLNRN
jgi:hypothetical protein